MSEEPRRISLYSELVQLDHSSLPHITPDISPTCSTASSPLPTLECGEYGFETLSRVVFNALQMDDNDINPVYDHDLDRMSNRCLDLDALSLNDSSSKLEASTMPAPHQTRLRSIDSEKYSTTRPWSSSSSSYSQYFMDSPEVPKRTTSLVLQTQLPLLNSNYPSPSQTEIKTSQSVPTSVFDHPRLRITAYNPASSIIDDDPGPSSAPPTLGYFPLPPQSSSMMDNNFKRSSLQQQNGMLPNLTGTHKVTRYVQSPSQAANTTEAQIHPPGSMSIITSYSPKGSTPISPISLWKKVKQICCIPQSINQTDPLLREKEGPLCASSSFNSLPHSPPHSSSPIPTCKRVQPFWRPVSSKMEKSGQELMSDSLSTEPIDPYLPIMGDADFGHDSNDKRHGLVDLEAKTSTRSTIPLSDVIHPVKKPRPILPLLDIRQNDEKTCGDIVDMYTP